MYHITQLAVKYAQYMLTAKNGKGHGIHSPFVYELVRNVFNNPSKPAAWHDIEALRKLLLKDDSLLQINDFGAGSSKGLKKQRSIRQIAVSSLKSPKYARLLHRMVQYFQPKNMVELGTSLGITTAYLASANKQSKVVTLEGADAIAQIAKQHFQRLQLNNIQLVVGHFDETLLGVMNEAGKIDFVFVDGNHAFKPTLRYFKTILPYTHADTVMVFDDIHWSAEMEKVWDAIRNDSAVTLSIDLFFMGIVFFRSQQHEKQHFTIRY
ncbi:MAG: class I SAM-dependent methyltransferase [Bacteroidetes bacterium]|nr:class I SAM-dependent methyltransferase [Bacteroidota bacterium]